MIGCLLYYGLYPLTRYFFSTRFTVASKKDLSASLVTRKIPDSIGVTAKSQRDLQEQWAAPSGSGTGLKEPDGGKEDDELPAMDKVQLGAVLYVKANNERVLKKDEVGSTLEQRKTEIYDVNEEDGAGAPKQGDQNTTLVHEKVDVKQNEVEGNIYSDGATNQESGVSVQCQNQSAEEGMLEAISPTEEQIHKTCIEKPRASTPEAAARDEYWDEDMLVDSEEISGPGSCLKLDLRSELLKAQTHPDSAEVMCCPQWHPSLSFYPQLREVMSFEVMWREWEEVSVSSKPTESSLPHHEAFYNFTIMSYNILAQDLLEVHQELYSHCSQEVLEWSYRCHLLIEEIEKWGPDILCLQEVQENHYEEHLHPVLCHMGYICVYKRRTGTKTDGCATCYRGNRFSELSVSLLEFHRPETGLLDRDNVGVVLLLQPLVTYGSEVKAKGPPLCVANTHLLFNPRRGDIKLAQLAIILAEINKVVKSCKVKGGHCNAILCGDFNSVPNTPLYQLITTGQLFYQGLPAWMVSGQRDLSHQFYHHRLIAPLWPSSLGISDNCQYINGEEEFESKSQDARKLQYNHDFLLQLQFCPAACVRPLDLMLIPGVTDNTPDASKKNQLYTKSFRFSRTIHHQLNLRSAYKHILSISGQMEVTTLHSEGAATTDYIFYTPKCSGHLPSEGLKLIGCLSLLSEEDLWSMKGLPNEMFPSDHLSLLAEFQLDLRPA